IKNVGPVTAHISHFWEEKEKELKNLFAYILEKAQKLRIGFKRKVLLLYVSISISIYVYMGISLHRIMLNFSNLLVWFLFGMITAILMFTLFNFYAMLYIWILTRVTTFIAYVSVSSRFCTYYGITKLFFYGCLIVSYTFSSNVYKYIYPS